MDRSPNHYYTAKQAVLLLRAELESITQLDSWQLLVYMTHVNYSSLSKKIYYF